MYKYVVDAQYLASSMTDNTWVARGIISSIRWIVEAEASKLQMVAFWLTARIEYF